MQADQAISNLLTVGRNWLEEQFAQTQRLRPLLAGAALVSIFGLLLVAIAAANSRARNLHEGQIELARLTKQISEGSWAERKRQSETLRFQLSERFWAAETAGLAEASLERWLRERIERQGLKPDSIRVQRTALGGGREDAADPSVLEGVQRMTAKVIMPFEPDVLFQLLNEATSNERILVIDRLIMRAGRNSLIEMDISTFVRLTEPAR
jgi:HAMP domain-containing protein